VFLVLCPFVLYNCSGFTQHTCSFAHLCLKCTSAWDHLGFDCALVIWLHSFGLFQPTFWFNFVHSFSTLSICICLCTSLSVPPPLLMSVLFYWCPFLFGPACASLWFILYNESFLLLDLIQPRKFQKLSSTLIPLQFVYHTHRLLDPWSWTPDLPITLQKGNHSTRNSHPIYNKLDRYDICTTLRGWGRWDYWGFPFPDFL